MNSLVATKSDNTAKLLVQKAKIPEHVNQTSEEVTKTGNEEQLVKVKRGIDEDHERMAGQSSSSMASNRSYIKLTLGNNPKSPLLTCVMQSGVKLYLYYADITKLNVGAIVNAANERLLHSGGVAWAISQAAGSSFQRESDKYIRECGKIPLSNVMVQAAGPRLPCMHVINAVGPEWYKFSNKEKCKNALVCTFFNCFRCANETCRVPSLALPPISAGKNPEKCATIIKKYYPNWQQTIEHLILLQGFLF